MRHLALVKPNVVRPRDERGARPGGLPEEMLKCSYRPADADFYCWRFKIWYNTLDCAYRTRYRTFDGCSDCTQGDFNLASRRKDLPVQRGAGKPRS
jgi:hypothetical protein